MGPWPSLNPPSLRQFVSVLPRLHYNMFLQCCQRRWSEAFSGLRRLEVHPGVAISGGELLPVPNVHALGASPSKGTVQINRMPDNPKKPYLGDRRSLQTTILGVNSFSAGSSSPLLCVSVAAGASFLSS